MSNPRTSRLRGKTSLNHVDSGHVSDGQEHHHPPASNAPLIPSEERSSEAHTQGIEKAALEEKRISQDPPETRQWPEDIVTFDSQTDPANARNWPFRKKALATILLGTTTMCSTFASSVFASGFQDIAEEFDVSKEVVILGLSLYVLGYIPGPVIFAPLSEMYGRKVSVVIPMSIFICLSAATATAKDLQTIFITRFFAGVVASAPVSNVGGGLADMFDQKERATAVVFYSLMVVSGPTFGPVIGGAVVQSFLGWRWTQYLIVILTSFVIALDVLVLPETFAGAILTRKARALRLKTGRWALHSKRMLEMNDFTVQGFLEKNLQRPIRMLSEPMIFAITLYNSFAFGILYLLFSAVPIIFQENRGWNILQASLPFLAVMLGNFIAAGFNIWYSVHVFAARMEKNGGHAEPESRLPPMMLGGITFPIGFFLLGWTSDPSIHWLPSVIGLMFIGMSFFLIFQAGINYLIDGYTKYSASAIATNTFMRSFVAAALPLVTPSLFHNLGIKWACTLLGGISILLSAIPYFFYVFGGRWRGASPFVEDGFR